MGNEMVKYQPIRYLALFDDRFLVDEVLGWVAAVRADPGREPLAGEQFVHGVRDLPYWRAPPGHRGPSTTPLLESPVVWNLRRGQIADRRVPCAFKVERQIPQPWYSHRTERARPSGVTAPRALRP